MRKRYIFILIGLSILLTGCGNEKLICTNEEETTKDMWLKQKIVMTFQKDKITKLKLERKLKVDGDYKKTVDLLEKTLKEEFTSFKDDAIKVKTSKSGKTVKLIVDANYKKMKEKTRKSFGTAPYNNNKEEMKKYLEKKRFTCK